MGDPATVLPSFPLPPPFFKHYADAPKGGGAAAAAQPQHPPPPPPPSGSYVVFGHPFDPDEPDVPPLQGRRLYEVRPDGSVDIKGELSRLTTEFMFVYSEVLRVLSENPTNYASPLNTLNQLLLNMQHLNNMLRPVQARASLEYVLQLQIEEKREALASLRAKSEAIHKAIAATATELQAQCGPASGQAAEDAMEQ